MLIVGLAKAATDTGATIHENTRVLNVLPGRVDEPAPVSPRARFYGGGLGPAASERARARATPKKKQDPAIRWGKIQCVA